MTVKEVDYSKTFGTDKYRGRRPGLTRSIIVEFAKSGRACVEIVDYPHKNLESARTTFIRSVRDYGAPHITVCTRRGKLYLINKLVIAQQKIE